MGDDEIPRIADFGLARRIGDELRLTTTTISGSTRWMAPEQLSGQKITTETDIWTYGMTVLVRTQTPSSFGKIYNISLFLQEIIAGTPPYSELHMDTMVIKAIDSGKLPAWPQKESISVPPHVEDAIKKTCHRCWVLQPAHRASITAIQEDLSGVADVNSQQS